MFLGGPKMKKFLLLLLCSGLFYSEAFAEGGILGSWFQKSTSMTFTIMSDGKNYSVVHKFPSGKTETYKLILLSGSASGLKGAKFQRKFDDFAVFFRQPEMYFINPDGSLTFNYSAESAALSPVR
jgi:hypothetical protein